MLTVAAVRLLFGASYLGVERGFALLTVAVHKNESEWKKLYFTLIKMKKKKNWLRFFACAISSKKVSHKFTVFKNISDNHVKTNLLFV